MDELVKIKCSKELINRFVDKGSDFCGRIDGKNHY